MSRRLLFIHEALSLVNPGTNPDGTPKRILYRWGGKEPETGLDCSGLVTWCLWRAGGPDWRATHNSRRLWRELPATDKPRPGDCAFYGPTSDAKAITHVMAVLEPGNKPGAYVVVGASGGDSDTTTPEIAIYRRAFVKTKPTHLYRPGFRGFRRLVPLDT